MRRTLEKDRSQGAQAERSAAAEITASHPPFQISQLPTETQEIETPQHILIVASHEQSKSKKGRELRA